ncbi:hypothetical protein [Flavobacterium cerinum]|uniref:DUF4843 domain-containing protein n=1 Tax=Flavobacterium cerinum TaxID=2502784 RepID=A0ABY5IVW6_9FLAO|nr:hypothetical protein [Flavobacterium cerinum]UUC45662.1 hypothetical protein NOX80_00265 [Flavobacterium cerinum]
MKNIKLLLLFVASAVMTVSCDLGDEAPSYGDSRAIVGFAKTTQGAGIVTDGTNKRVNAVIEVIGGNLGLPAENDIAVTYDVDASSTATLGHEFDFALTERTLIIPAGTKSVVVPIDVHSGNVVVGQDKTIVLKVTAATSASAVVVGSNYSKLSIRLQGLCFSNLAGNYYIPYTSGNSPVVITKVGDGNYKSNRTPGWPTAPYEFYFTDICGQLTVTGWSNSNAISGTGTVQTNGDILIALTIDVTGYPNGQVWPIRKVN